MINIFLYFFFKSNDLTEIAKFLTQIPGCGFQRTVPLEFYMSSDSTVCFAVAFPLLGNADYVFVSVSVGFSSDSKWDALLHPILPE